MNAKTIGLKMLIRFSILSLIFLIGCAPTYPIVYKMKLKDNERLVVNPNESVVITVNKDSVEIEKE